MDKTIYVIVKVLFDHALEVWFSIYRNCSKQCCIQYVIALKVMMLCNTEKQNSQCERRTTNEANKMLYLPLFVFHVRITCAELEG